MQPSHQCFVSQGLKLTTTSLVVPLNALWRPPVAGQILPAWDKGRRKRNVGFFSWTTPTIWCSNKHTSTTPLTFHVSQTPLTPGSCYLNVAYLVFQDNIWEISWNGWHDSKLQFGYSRDSILVLHLVDIMQKVICVLYPTMHYTFSFPVNLQVALFMDLIYAFCRCFYSK